MKTNKKGLIPKLIDLTPDAVRSLTVQAAQDGTVFKHYTRRILEAQAFRKANHEWELLNGILELSKESITELRKLNAANGRLYSGKELTKNQLIFQLVFLMDAPD